ncbi:DUF3263 domain-containing protein [Microbacterium sp.]|uniref:DUF3263 domain-containing protein n=1 Tax=Microbacterium sp. TaxID=51671 RepID=UPI003C73B138
MPLSDRDVMLLDFESRWSGGTERASPGAKEEAVRTELGLTPARYYQLLGRVIDAPDAAAHDAMLVHRLRRVRDARERERAGRATAPAVRPPYAGQTATGR